MGLRCNSPSSPDRVAVSAFLFQGGHCQIPQFYLDGKQSKLSSERVFMKIELIDIEHFFIYFFYFDEANVKIFASVFAEQ